jgi:Ammonium Transporter Family
MSEAPPGYNANNKFYPFFDSSGVFQAGTLNSGDTAWMLTSTALVLLMTMPGLAIYYSGMVRDKNVLACKLVVSSHVIASLYVRNLRSIVKASRSLHATLDLHLLMSQPRH